HKLRIVSADGGQSPAHRLLVGDGRKDLLDRVCELRAVLQGACHGREITLLVMSPSLADYTTLRLGGPAGRMLEVKTDDELVAAVAERDAAGEPVLLLGGGS